MALPRCSRPEDADCIVDNTSTGATLKANGLTIFSDLLQSSTRIYACPRSLDDLSKRDVIEHLVLLVRSVTDARRRVMVEINVGSEQLEGLVRILPCMRYPTVSPLPCRVGFAVRPRCRATGCRP